MAQIKKELEDVKKINSHWNSLYQEALKSSKESTRPGESDTQSKQRLATAQQNITVDQIKADIYNDRQIFLDKLVKLGEK